ncbi:MAG: DUF4446 family protein [Candidatus Pacebacteria bacterium]|nr:DUF4446 family protein [Candidatus Paceibacterota bacterium]
MIFKKKSQNPEELKDLKEAVKYIKALESKIDKLEKIVKQNEERSLDSFTKFSVLRFNPFSNMGGDQSFTLALLNEKNNGFILTSLYGRDGARLFTKPINNGMSEYQLLEEEKNILKKAMGHE